MSAENKADPFAHNAELHQAIQQVTAACVGRRMLITLGTQLPLVAVDNASTVVQRYFRKALMQRKSAFGLWRVFEFWVLRAVKCRQQLRKCFHRWIQRRRQEIADCIERWNIMEKRAQMELPFLLFMTLWVSEKQKREVVVEFRRHCCHQLLVDCAEHIAAHESRSQTFFDSVYSLRCITVKSYRIVKELVLFLISNCYNKLQLVFKQCNLYTLICVAARRQFHSGDQLDDEVVLRKWIASRVQHRGDVPAGAFTEDPTLAIFVAKPIFPDDGTKWQRRKQTALFCTPLVVSPSAGKGRARKRAMTSLPRSSMQTFQKKKGGDGPSTGIRSKVVTPEGKEDEEDDDGLVAQQTLTNFPTIHGNFESVLREQASSYALVGDGWIDEPRWQGLMCSEDPGRKGPDAMTIRRTFRKYEAETRRREMQLQNKQSRVMAEELRLQREIQSSASVFRSISEFKPPPPAPQSAAPHTNDDIPPLADLCFVTEAIIPLIPLQISVNAPSTHFVAAAKLNPKKPTHSICHSRYFGRHDDPFPLMRRQGYFNKLSQDEVQKIRNEASHVAHSPLVRRLRDVISAKEKEEE